MRCVGAGRSKADTVQHAEPNTHQGRLPTSSVAWQACDLLPLLSDDGISPSAMLPRAVLLPSYLRRLAGCRPTRPSARSRTPSAGCGLLLSPRLQLWKRPSVSARRPQQASADEVGNRRFVWRPPLMLLRDACGSGECGRDCTVPSCGAHTPWLYL